MAYVIFGGSGFVGNYLARKLSEKGKVVICDLVKPCDGMLNMDYYKIDVRKDSDLEQVPLEKEDVVVNLAANQYHTRVPKKGRDKYFSDTNTRGVANILSWMEKHGCRKLIQYTTDMIYGKPQYLPVDTEHPQVPFGPYGQSKKDAEDICRKYRKKGFHITIFRPRMISGPGRLGILRKLFILIKYGFPVPTIGNGRNCYQMVSVFDCVTATVLAIEKGCPNHEYNLGSEHAPAIKTLLQGLVESAGSKSLVIPTPGRLVKMVLEVLGVFGIEIMYKEQYMIADENYISYFAD